MDGYECYKLYMALSSHFDPGRAYDYFKYGGKTNVTYKAFQKRRDGYIFDKISRLPNPRLRMICALAEGVTYIGDIVGDKGRSAQMKHQKYMDAAGYNFQQELPELPQPIGKLVAHDQGMIPPLAQLFYQKKIRLQTLIILNNLLDYVSIWKSRSITDPLLYKLVHTIEKFTPFFVYEKDKTKQIFVDYLLNTS